MTAMPAPLSFARPMAEREPASGRASGSPPSEFAGDGVGYLYERRAPNFFLIGGIAAIHVAALALGISTGAVPLNIAPPAIQTFEVADTPPPPAEEPVALEQVAVDVPPPSLVIVPPPDVAPPPRPSPVRAVVSVAPPAPALTAVSAPAIVAAPPAPPAPIVPPDFSAGQLDNPAPKIPYLSRRNKEQGRVVLRVLVSVEGKASKVELDRSSGFDRLDKAAMETIAKWKFLPARQAGNPVAAWVLVPVSFASR